MKRLWGSQYEDNSSAGVCNWCVFLCIYTNSCMFIMSVFFNSYEVGVILFLIGNVIYSLVFIARSFLLITITENVVTARCTFLGTRGRLYWDEITEIRYYPLLRRITIRASFWSRLPINYLVKNYKQAWRDIVLYAQESNPDIVISPKLIKKLQKENLL